MINTELFRSLRMRRFLERLDLAGPVKILDVGGTVEFWTGRLPANCTLVILNVFEQKPIQGETVLVGDATDLSRFQDKSFDIVFSNSALAFVGGLERQRLMVAEMQRVGIGYYLQTPNQDYWLDWRTYVPFFHWLAPRHQARLLLRTRIGRYPRISDPAKAMEMATRVQDVDRATLQEFFPGGTIEEERLLGGVKSFTVHNLK